MISRDVRIRYQQPKRAKGDPYRLEFNVPILGEVELDIAVVPIRRINYLESS